MRKITLENFYKKYQGYLDVTAGYLEDRRFPFILQSCRLRPQISNLEVLPKTPRLERWWMDEFGNTFKIGKNKRIKIIYNDLKINHNWIRCTDLFANVSLLDLFTISKFLYICYGKSEIDNQDIFVLSFLGKDNFFRTRLFYNNTWDKQISTLYLGINVLKSVTENINIKYYSELSKAGPKPNFPMVDVRQWVTYLPAHYKFREFLKSESEFMFKTIGLDIMETVWNG